jgi:DNA repair exonuclease SbcCD ATPase subunit
MHLDDNRIEELVGVLQELRNIPQLIIVDHREELIKSADVTYKTKLEEDFSIVNLI